jgi:hypothetical protein
MSAHSDSVPLSLRYGFQPSFGKRRMCFFRLPVMRTPTTNVMRPLGPAPRCSSLSQFTNPRSQHAESPREKYSFTVAGSA